MYRKKPKDPALCHFFMMIQPMREEEQRFIIERSFGLMIRRGGLLFKPGSRQRCIYLIKKGVVRSYVVEGNRQITTWVNEENELVAPGRTLGLELPSIEYLQALETTELCGIDYEHIEYMYEHYPVSNKIGRILLEENYRGAEQRAYLARISSAAKRYQRFTELQPSLLNRIPLKYIASYLNMSLETLSRIRGKKMI